MVGQSIILLDELRTEVGIERRNIAENGARNEKRNTER